MAEHITYNNKFMKKKIFYIVLTMIVSSAVVVGLFVSSEHIMKRGNYKWEKSITTQLSKLDLFIFVLTQKRTKKVKTSDLQRSKYVLFPKRNKLEQVLKQHFFSRKFQHF